MKSTGDIRIDKIMPRLNESWFVVPFEKSLISPKVKYKKLKVLEIKPTGQIPVIDQGERFICGYTDDPANEYPGPLPVVVFGDHTRRFKFVNFKFSVGADGTQLLHSCEALMPKFFYYYLCSLNLESQGYSRHYKFLKTTSVPIPTLEEQRRIVAKLEKLLDKVETSRTRLEKIPTILKRFRQSVLASACSGRLTEEWQKNHRNQFWDEKTIGELELFIGSGITPRGGKSVYVTSGIPFIRSQNVHAKGLVFKEIAYITQKMHQKMSRTHLRPLDVLLNITGASIGRSTIVPENFEEGNVNQHVCIIRCQSVLWPKFLSIFLNSPSGQDMIFDTQVGVTREGLNYDQIRTFPIPIPPLPEQHEIVRRVEELFALADRIEARYQKAKVHVDKLTQSILSKAFRGELVPQDPNDEPASDLLKRSKAQKVQDSPPKGLKKKKEKDQNRLSSLR